MADISETPETPTAAPKRSMNIWIILSIIAAVLICCCFLAFFVIPAVISIFGAAPGNDILDVIEKLGNPMP
jgi:hypothetical protein